MKLNPRHPVTQAADGNWHKFLALVMHKSGIDTIDLSEKDINGLVNRYPGQMATVVVREMAKERVIRLSIVSEAEGRRLANAEDPN